MKPLRRGWLRVLGSLWRGRGERELDDEVASHIDMQIEDNVRAGMSDAEARRAARLKFGSVDAAKESYRDQRGLPSLDSLAADFRYAFRGLRKSSGFTAVAVCTLAVAVGANTAVFSVVDQVLLRPHGIANPDRIIAVRTKYTKINLDFVAGSLRSMEDLRQSPQVFEYAAAGSTSDANYTGNGAPERLLSATVTADWFAVFGAKPALGLTFTHEDDQPNANPVIVLSYGTWLRLYGGDRSVLGRTIELNDVPRQIIGVMAPEFGQPAATDVWEPSGLGPGAFTEQARFNENVQVVALRRPDVSSAQVDEWMKVLTGRVYESAGQGPIARTAGWSISADPFVDAAAGETKAQLWMLFGAVGVVALIACANIAGLLLARASARAREFSVRVALGASISQLMRGVIAESMILATLGGVLGTGLAYGGIRALLALAPESAEMGLGPRLDWLVLGYTMAMVSVAALLFGTAPLWRIARMHGRPDLSGGRATTASKGRMEARTMLVVAETALALMLLVASGLFLRSLTQLQRVDPGFDERGVMSAWISPPQITYPTSGPNSGKRGKLFWDIWQRLRTSPGVAAAALISQPPFSGGGDAGAFEIEGRVIGSGEFAAHGNDRRVTPDYFEALHIPLKRGRSFTAEDLASNEPVIVIDENLARQYWPGEDPLNKRMRKIGDTWFRIVGVVGHVVDSNLAADSGKGFYYYSLFQRGSRAVSIVARSNGDANQMPAAIRDAVRAADARLPVHTFSSMQESVSRSLAPRRFGLQLVGFFASVGLFLAALGLYGLISYSVTQRTRELGIRMALGAERLSLVGMVVSEGLRLAFAGAVIGLIASFVSGRWIQSQLYKVGTFDPMTIGAVIAVLLFAAALASYLPARRAVRIDPAIALRPE